MICAKCGADVKEGFNFCEECGASLKQTPPRDIPGTGDFPKSNSVVCSSNLAAVTNIGRRHPKNEDAGTVFEFNNGDKVLIVADGVSSSLSATTASQLAIEAIKENMNKNTEMSPRDMIISAINEADTCVKGLPYETREDGIYGPEATVVVALVRSGMVTIGWVGDSRAYILNKDSQELLTIDDSWVEMVVSDGSMTREEALKNKLAHAVTQVLGMHDQEIQVHTLEHKLKSGDMLLVCSDGLWNYFQSENALLRAIAGFGMNSETVHICEHLVGLANSSGGRDNITAALLRME